ncbi:MAG: TerC family protein [Planctomycetota bacterium]
MTTLLANENILFPFAEYWGFYAGFTAFVFVLLALDLGVFHRKAHAVSMKEATAWTGIWMSLAVVFCGLLWWYCSYRFPQPDRVESVLAAGYHTPAAAAKEVALQFLTGFVVEQSLSVDNMFVFVVIFGFFHIPASLQHRILFYGILGALAFRAVFIAIGAALIQYKAVVIVFGAFLVFTGFKIIFTPEKEKDPEHNPILKLLRRLVPLTSKFHDQRFFVKELAPDPHGVGKKALRWVGTPLFVALVMIEVSDIVFAVDSVPAIFAVTKEPFIVFTSNVFAILGLRSLYFLLAGAHDKFHMLKYGLGIVLVFVGIKMTLPESWYPESWDGHFPMGWSLAFIVGVIGGSMVLSVMLPKKHAPAKH